MDASLLATQKSQVFGILKDTGLDPHQFIWESIPIGAGTTKRSVSRIKSKIRPEFTFLFDFTGTRYLPSCSPWEDRRQMNFGLTIWDQSLEYVYVWAQCVQKE